MAKHSFKMSDVTGDARVLARSSLGYDFNYFADDETLIFGTDSDATIAWDGDSLNVTSSATEFTGTVADGDVIGKADTANCHYGQITAATNGTILSGYVQCLETPAGGEPDIDLYSNTVATLAEEAAHDASGSSTQLLATAADWTNLLAPKGLTTVPPADGYLYLVASGGATNDTYTAGKFIIKLYGYDA